jgi:hypothetical protein
LRHSGRSIVTTVTRSSARTETFAVMQAVHFPFPLGQVV